MFFFEKMLQSALFFVLLLITLNVDGAPPPPASIEPASSLQSKVNSSTARILRNVVCTGKMEDLKNMRFSLADIMESDENGLNSFHSAVFSGNVEIIKTLLDFAPNIDIEALTNNRNSALDLAIRTGNKSVIKYLLSKTIFPISGNTVKQILKSQDLDLLKLFIDEKPEIINVRDEFNTNILQMASYHGTVEMVNLILKVPFDQIYEIDSKDMNVLQYASAGGRWETFLLFKDEPFNFDLTARDEYGNSILDLAIMNHRYEFAESLFEYNLDCRLESAFFVIKDEAVEFLERLLAVHTYLLDLDLANCTLVQFVASYGSVKTMRIILNHSSAVDRIYRLDPRGKNVLHYAAGTGNMDMIRFLLQETDLDVNSLDFKGNSVLDFAVDFKDLLDFLLQETGAESSITYDTCVGASLIDDVANSRLLLRECVHLICVADRDLLVLLFDTFIAEPIAVVKVFSEYLSGNGPQHMINSFAITIHDALSPTLQSFIETPNMTSEDLANHFQAILDGTISDEMLKSFSTIFLYGYFCKFRDLVVKNQDPVCSFIGKTEGHPDFSESVIMRYDIGQGHFQQTIAYVTDVKYGSINFMVYEAVLSALTVSLNSDVWISRNYNLFLEELDRHLEMITIHELSHACLYYRLHSISPFKTSHEYFNSISQEATLRTSESYINGIHEGFAQYVVYLSSHPQGDVWNLRFPQKDFDNCESFLPEFYKTFRLYVQTIAFHKGHEGMIKCLFEDFEAPYVHLGVVNILPKVMHLESFDQAEYIGVSFDFLETLSTNGGSGLHYAAERGDLQLVKYLIESTDINLKVIDMFGYSAIDLAIVNDQYSVAEYLLHNTDMGCDVSSAVHLIKVNNGIDLLNFVLRSRPFLLEMIFAENSTFLHVVADMGNVRATEMMLRLGLSREFYEKCNDEGNNALHLAAFNQHFKVLVLLLDSGLVDAKVPNLYGDTLLDIVIGKGYDNLIEYLLVERTDIDCPFRSLGTLIDNNRYQLLDSVLGKKSKYLENAVILLLYSAEHGTLDSFKVVLHHFPHLLNETDDMGLNALHYAANAGNLRVVMFLCMQTSIETVSNFISALDLAIANLQYSVVENLLLYTKIPCNLQSAFILMESGQLRLLNLLLSHRPEIITLEIEGKNVFDYAAILGNPEIDEILEMNVAKTMSPV